MPVWRNICSDDERVRKTYSNLLNAVDCVSRHNLLECQRGEKTAAGEGRLRPSAPLEKTRLELEGDINICKPLHCLMQSRRIEMSKLSFHICGCSYLPPSAYGICSAATNRANQTRWRVPLCQRSGRNGQAVCKYNDAFRFGEMSEWFRMWNFDELRRLFMLAGKAI